MTRALILAAGQGTRLRPLTNDIPKCLVPLIGVSLLQRQTKILKDAGISEVLVATGYQSEKIEALGYSTVTNDRFERTNMVETLFCARDFIDRAGDLLIAYGDIVYQAENLNAILASNDEISLMIDENWRQLWEVRLEDPLEDAETLILDNKGYIKELGKRPEGYHQIQGQYTGLIKIRSDKVNDLLDFYDQIDRSSKFDGKNFENMYMTAFLQLLIDSGWPIKAVLVQGGWLEVDSIEDLKAYEDLHQKGLLQSLCML